VWSKIAISIVSWRCSELSALEGRVRVTVDVDADLPLTPGASGGLEWGQPHSSLSDGVHVEHVFDWDSLYADYASLWAELRKGNRPGRTIPAAAVERIANPSHQDARWISEALHDGAPWPESKAWFVVDLIRHAGVVPEVFLIPLLDAGIAEVNPSANREFIEPCVKSFGRRRVSEYLLHVVQSGTDFQIAGAVNALYWGLFAGHESADAGNSLEDLLERTRHLLLTTFVANPNIDVRRSLISHLELDANAYPLHLRGLVTEAIVLARHHHDPYIRHRVEVQLGNHMGLFAPLPHRPTKLTLTCADCGQPIVGDKDENPSVPQFPR
jgi:hypothetical protein